MKGLEGGSSFSPHWYVNIQIVHHIVFFLNSSESDLVKSEDVLFMYLQIFEVHIQRGEYGSSTLFLFSANVRTGNPQLISFQNQLLVPSEGGEMV